MNEDNDNWVSDSDLEILQRAKEQPQHAVPSPSQHTIDHQLAELRKAGDAAAYESARERAMQDALDAGNDEELVRLSEANPPFGTHPPEAPNPGPTPQEAAELQHIFDDPKYRAAMGATDGSPEQMTEVYDRFKVPPEARITITPNGGMGPGPNGESAPLYGQVSR